MRMTIPALMAFALALPLAASPVMAAPAGVRVDDLDLDSPAGKATLETRIASVARDMCRDVTLTGTRLARTTCEHAVHDEVFAKLAARQSRYGKGG